ncbi:GmrSD restriction endonuclease domain-containing protein [Candidatus Binatus sp.]|uniref:GmrSD restriction endonuclease domain-containing protein n=1 Tax=Candidatus Binatus sp. TaxID=2811406 RepID=UPI003CC63A01
MPKQDTTVASLVSMIKSGELRLPEMQRRYIWPATRVRDLLDSLYREYPSGTILVWETDQEAPNRGLAIDSLKSPFMGHKLLLDGQQRLTSLTAVLKGEPVLVRNRKKPIEILFNIDHPEGPPTEVQEIDDDQPQVDDNGDDEDEDSNGPNIQERLKSKTFVVASRALAADPHWISVSTIFQDGVADATLLRPLVKSFEDPNFDRFARRLQKVRRIRDYPYVMHILDKSLSYEEVAEIFVRVNSLGVKLRGSDLAIAQITSRWHDSLKLFEEFQEECEERWFNLELGLIVRGLVVFATGQSRFKTSGTIPVANLKNAWLKAKEGMRFAINFLRSNAFVEDESLLSSPLFIIALAFYADAKNYQLTREEEKLLRRWLLLANARGHYSGSSETVLDSDLAIVRKGDGPKELIDALKQQVGRLEVEAGDFAGRGQRSPLLSMSYLALKVKGAHDWRTGLALSLSHSGRMHFIEHHHIFPRAQLKGDYDKAEVNEIANMAFVSGSTNRSISSKPTEQYLAQVVAEQGENALIRHCIPTDRTLWRNENYRGFLEFRRRALADAVNHMMLAEADSMSAEIDVAQVVSRGESELVEFKSSVRWNVVTGVADRAMEMAVTKTVAAFCNSKGGVVIIGVADDGTFLGLEQDYATLGKAPNRDGYQQFVATLLSTAMGKSIGALVSIAIVTIKGKEVCLVNASESGRPVYIQEGANSRFFVRIGTTTQELSVRDATEYISSRWEKPD